MHETSGILVGKGEAPQHLLFAMANRHGLIAGATGTGKTVSVRVLAEGLAQGGVAVFLADVKGDLSGIGQPALDIQDLMATDAQGSIHLLAAEDLIQRSRLYATFLLALLSEIFEELPEVRAHLATAFMLGGEMVDTHNKPKVEELWKQQMEQEVERMEFARKELQWKIEITELEIKKRRLENELEELKKNSGIRRRFRGRLRALRVFFVGPIPQRPASGEKTAPHDHEL